MRKSVKIIGGIVVVGFAIGVFGNLSGNNQPEKSAAKTSQSKPATKPVSQPAKKPSVKLVDGLNPNQLEMVQSELASLGDWGISSSQQELQGDMQDVQNSLNQGDNVGAYNTAKQAASKADNWNTQTMSEQDMSNVPADVPADIRATLKNVDPNLADAYMYEKMAFNNVSDYVNGGDLSKLDTAKQDFQLANTSFANAKSFIDRANQKLGVKSSQN